MNAILLLEEKDAWGPGKESRQTLEKRRTWDAYKGWIGAPHGAGSWTRGASQAEAISVQGARWSQCSWCRGWSGSKEIESAEPRITQCWSQLPASTICPDTLTGHIVIRLICKKKLGLWHMINTPCVSFWIFLRACLCHIHHHCILTIENN